MKKRRKKKLSIKKILLQKKELLLPIYIIINLLYILVGSILFTVKKISIETFSRGYIVLLAINVIIIILLLIFKRKKEIKLQLHDCLLLLIILFGAIATQYAVVPKISLFGEWGRYEGFFSICYYLTLTFICSFIDKKYKKIIIYTILICGFIHFIYAMLQVTGIGKNVVRMKRDGVWASGFLTNMNFFGTYMIMCLSYAIGLFADEKKKALKILFMFLILVFTIGLLRANTLSCIVGFIPVLIYIIVYLLTNKKVKELIVILFIIVATSMCMTTLKFTRVFDDFIKTGSEVKEISKGNSKDNYGTNRMFIYKSTIKIVPKYLLHGAGIDNFAHAFNGGALRDSRWLYDKAHCEYLQILVCEGIFCLITYLLLYALIVIKGIKHSFKEKTLYLILPIIGYLAQATFNISVIEVAPLFYIALGLCIKRESRKKI